MRLYEKIIKRKEKISVVGLGYVGMPLAVAFAEKVDVIGFDINKQKVEEYKRGHDITNEVGDEKLKQTTVYFTSDESDLRRAKFHVVAVPTPINDDTTPDLTPVIGASRVVGRNLTEGSIVVFESTVYPGVTEEICVPILEKESGLKCGVDFKIGYSPERINPGDKVHTVDKIIKIVSGMDAETLEDVAKVYEIIIAVGVHRAESIKVAEAAKVIENSQRDINIAFMNELSIIFNKMGIDTKAVLEAAGTKWNFLKFTPGLVGGHCIGVDPYYLTYRAQQLGYNSQVILSGRRINDNMGKYVAESTVKNLIKVNKQINGAKVILMGITFKENCPDVRNSKVIDIIRELEDYGVCVNVYDPIANENEVMNEYNIQLCDQNELNSADAVIFAVSHNEFNEYTLENVKRLYEIKIEDGALKEIAATNLSHQKQVLIDVKGIFDRKEAEEKGYSYWRL
ncbi:nucleotide sugar dehydrogenase [Clostridium tunisiense]|uniref:nucleotide sugar dehydrogenase n=1 Tax=Clostridium tunisiense TaxID=219748 RepID=UPI0003076317|nr:nucleotide sugar dehydrogenase [Clostridium tunisiense]